MKSRRDIENLGEMFAKAAEGVNAKSAYHIQEVCLASSTCFVHLADASCLLNLPASGLEICNYSKLSECPPTQVPEAAVAALVPSSLHAVLEDRGSPDVDSSQMLTLDAEVDQCGACTAGAMDQYAVFAESAKNLVWDVERLNMIIQAYDKDLHKLKNDGGLMKSRINALRLMWRAKFSSVRRWQDYTRRSHVERFQEQLDEAQSQFEVPPLPEHAHRLGETQMHSKSKGLLRDLLTPVAFAVYPSREGRGPGCPVVPHRGPEDQGEQGEAHPLPQEDEAIQDLHRVAHLVRCDPSCSCTLQSLHSFVLPHVPTPHVRN